MADQRSSIFNKPATLLSQESLADFKPKSTPPAIAPIQKDLEQVAEKTGFVSRENSVRKQRRFKTGRNVQLSLKVSQNAVDIFYSIADEMSNDENPKTLGQIFEEAVKTLQREMNRKSAKKSS